MTAPPDRRGSLSSSYFAGGLSAGGSLTQPPLVAPSGIQQKHGPVQCTVALQTPRQNPINWASLCNCRAETVPAERTVARIDANNAVLAIFLTMCMSSF